MVACAAGAAASAAQQPTGARRALRDEIDHFDRGVLRPAGVPHLASRAVSPLMPNAHGYMFVGTPGGALCMYGYGLQAGAVVLKKSRVKEFVACAKAQDMPFPSLLIEAMNARAGRRFSSHEALLEELRVATGHGAMPMSWRDFGFVFMPQLCRSSRRHFVMAAKTAGWRVTWRGIILQPRQLRRLRGVLPEAVCAALESHCGQRFHDAEALMQSVHPRPRDLAQQGAWQTWIAALDGEAQHVLGSQRSGHPIEQADEQHARSHPGQGSRAYPGVRHEFVRDAWRQLFWGREYLRERVLGLTALSEREAQSLRTRLAPIWMRCVPGSTAQAMPAKWFQAFLQRLPPYDDKRNCNSAAATLLREAAHLQRVHALREGLSAEPIPTLRGASWRNLGANQEIPVWRPLPYVQLEALALR